MQIKDIKGAVLYCRKAKYMGNEYTVNACQLFKYKNKLEYAIVLLDKSKNSVVYADLKEVELI